MKRSLRKHYPTASGRRAEARSLATTLVGSAGFPRGQTVPTLAGSAVNSQTALTITALWNAVTLLSNTIASLDFHVAERTGRNLVGRKPAPDHPHYDLTACRPNGRQSSFKFRQTIMGHALTRGSGFAEVERIGGYPVALHLMDPGAVDVREDAGKLWYHVPGAVDPLPADDVIHISGFGWDGVSGYNPITVMAETLGLAMSERVWQAAVYGNNGTPAGYFKVPGKMTTADKKELRRNMRLVHAGPENAGEFAILDGGMEWVKTAFSPVDAQLILGRSFSVAEVARIYNIPQHMLGNLEHATFSNIEEQNIQFYQLTLMPWLTMIEQEFSNKLLSRADRRYFAAWFDPSSILRGNLAARTTHITALSKIGAASLNDVCDEFGRDRIATPGADKHWIPTNNLAAIEDLDTTRPAPAPAPTIPPLIPQEPIRPAEPPALPAPAEAPDLPAIRPRSRRPSAELVAAIRAGFDAGRAMISPGAAGASDACSCSAPGPAEGPGDGPGRPVARSGAVEAVLIDGLGRMLRRESTAVRKAVRRDASAFHEWYGPFLADHRATVAEAIAPAVRLAAEVARREIDPAEVAAELVAESADRYRGLVASVPPDELPDAVGRALDAWDDDGARARAVADRLLDGDLAGHGAAEADELPDELPGDELPDGGPDGERAGAEDSTATSDTATETPDEGPDR